MSAEQNIPRTIDEGGYGRILRPAIPNYNEGGHPVYFPNHVTKIFFDESNYWRLVSKENMLKSTIGKEFVPQRYRHKMHGINLPPNERHALGISDKARVFMVHQPYFGRSLEWYFSRSKKGTANERVAACPPQAIFESIRHLLYQTYMMSTQHIVHGDIRPANIVFDNRNCTFTLIDFDFLDEYDNFYQDYKQNFGFYSNPPESLFVAAFEDELVANNDDPIQIDSYRFNDYVQNAYSEYMMYWNSIGVSSEEELQTKIENGLQRTEGYIKQLKYDKGLELYEIIVPSMDNYALALCLLEWLTRYPLPPMYNELILLLQDMSNDALDKRPTAKEAYERVMQLRMEGGRRRRQGLLRSRTRRPTHRTRRSTHRTRLSGRK